MSDEGPVTVANQFAVALAEQCRVQAVIAESTASHHTLLAAAERIDELWSALYNLLEDVENAITAGDWKIDGACDPDASLRQARHALGREP